MKSDIDALMQAKKLDAIVVIGSAENNPPMYYMTGGGHVSAATLVKKCGEEAVLYCNDMERDEAAKSGLTIRLYGEYPLPELFKDANGDGVLMMALRMQHIFKTLGVKGHVGLYGHDDVSATFATLSRLQTLMSEVEFFGETREESLFNQAMETKSEEEVARIREMGKHTTEIVRLTAEFLTSCDVRDDEVLLKKDGSPLTIGDVKQKIN